MTKRYTLFLALLAVASCTTAVRHDGPVYLDPARSVEERVADVLPRLTIEEKVALTHAQSKFSSRGVPRLGIPEVWCTDGPHGIRPEVLWDEWDQAGWTNDSCTAFPALSCLAATWDKDMSLLFGRSIGAEARYRKKDILLGPGVNICRTPLNGRNFEYMGEDPFLAGKMVVPYVQGVQENGVAACVKHYAVNNQETKRTATSSNLDDRTLYEIYLPAFETAVREGGAWAIMGSYNLYNGQFNCHNKRLLLDILKGEWGFDGVVVSDWGGCRDDDEAIFNGLDMEFGTWTNGLTGAASDSYRNYHLADPYLQRIADGRAGTKELDDKASRILRTIFRTSMSPEKHFGSFNSPEHYDAARKIAAAGTVLLQNNGALPLNIPDGGKLVIIGENAVKKMVVGGGSSSLKTNYEITPLEGLQEAFPNAEIIWERGYVGDTSTSYNKVDTGQDLSESRSPSQLLADALSAAEGADAVIFIGGLNKSKGQDNEGTDRADIVLPYGQDAVIEALSAAIPSLIVVNISGSPVAMPWADKVAAIVQGWYGGSESGRALADVLTGAVNPSGRLPFTLPKALSDGPLKTARQYPGIQEEGSKWWQEYYDEGVFVGYRWYDKENIPVQFPFGHGLSYTSFSYDNARLSRKALACAGSFPVDGGNEEVLKVSVSISNTGGLDGAEVVQLYVAPPAGDVERPVKELRGFEKISLKSGESGMVTIPLTRRAFSRFDPDAHCWVVDPGEWTIHLGSSSADLRTCATVSIK
ncbi:MAG: glycoside hydrolase family 3 C-terminal domain-containing protein [Bacteroidales bacterium]|nr:glycoside hydrolase family 3 C-terminal domain-containing protein [Bacteroidales bacterium]